MTDDNDHILGCEFEAWSVSGEYFLGAGKAVKLSHNGLRVDLQSDRSCVNVPVICLRQKSS